MGKFLEGLKQAQKAAEAVTAEHDRLGGIASEAIAKIAGLLKEDSAALDLHHISLHSERGALVVRRKLNPIASITYDSSASIFKISEYSGSKGSVEIAAQDAEDCALKLGVYIYSLGG